MQCIASRAMRREHRFANTFSVGNRSLLEFE